MDQLDFSQLRIYRPPLLKSGENFKKDAECAESERKILFQIFISRVIVKVHRKLQILSTKNDHISKTKYRKNLKIHFSFISAHSASFMHIWPLMKFWKCYVEKHFIFLSFKLLLFYGGRLCPPPSHQGFYDVLFF